MKRVLILVSLALIFLCIQVNAVELQSPRFNLQTESVGFQSDKKNNSYTSLSSLWGDKAYQLFKSQNYYMTSEMNSNISFSLSNALIDLGDLTLHKENSKSVSVDLNSNIQMSQLGIMQEYSLKSPSGEIIEETKCDDEQNPCNNALAKTWSSPTQYGFGYNAQGENVGQDFVGNTFYRPLPNQNQDKLPITLMINNMNKTKSHAIITFKINVNPSQAVGTYDTIIDFIALPGY